MNASELPAGLQHFSLATLASEPWRNGGGVTRTVARSAGDDPDWVWRVSIADIMQDGPFSPFPGVDRALALIEGRHLVLRGPVKPLRTERAGEHVRFCGEEPLTAELGDGPVRVWNVMTRHGRAESALHVSSKASMEWVASNSRTHTLLVVLDGRQRLLLPGGHATELLAGDGLWMRPVNSGLKLQATTPGSRVLLTAIHC